ncbi:hypothetical protein MHU86_19574 [Fragilaria crotonensis]|nr:hypothetical protein MHU86_19574 [Fragilaria crotonensis]
MNVNRLRKEKTSLGSPLSPLSRDRLPLGLLQSLVLLTIGFVVGRISNGHGNGNPSVATPKSPQNVALRSIPTTATMVPIETRSCDEEIDAAIANHVAATATATATSDTTILQKAQNELDNNATVCDASTCRNTIFVTQGQGGIGELTKVKVEKACSDPLSYNVCQDLANFTGLSSDELHLRLNRTGRFHFEGEHLFWNPTSPTELAWYYSTSVDYLFANAIHPALSRLVHLGEHHQPVLDYSGGVGNSILYLALEKNSSANTLELDSWKRHLRNFDFVREVSWDDGNQNCNHKNDDW